jgi:tripartite-type tricarboxylate transporter receptor subunit TctC
METQKVKTCFTLSFTHEQYLQAKAYVDDMKKHPKRVFWHGKEGKNEDELVVEQIAHRILSGFYNNDPLKAAKQIIKMDSATAA